MSFRIHLSAADRVNRPPTYFLQVQDALIVLSGLLWTISYCLYVRQAFLDRSYGMPLLCLCANVAWEFYFAVVEPLSVVQTVMLIAWLAVDLGMVYTTCLFGPGQWEQAPWISSHLGSIVLAGTLVMIVFTWTCAQTVGAEAASFYLAYASQLWLSIASVAMLLARNNTSGHSFGIWFFRASGTGATILLYSWRYWHFPQDYPIVAEPPVIFFFVGAAVTDLIYPAVYFSLEKK